MDIRYCKNCGKMFQYTNSPLCDQCQKEMEKKFLSVKEYIQENPAAMLGDISENCDVPLPQIKRWIKEERLSFTKESGIKLSCEKCGASILTGCYCQNCKKNMTERLGSMYQKEEQPSPVKKTGTGENKMRFLGK